MRQAIAMRTWTNLVCSQQIAIAVTNTSITSDNTKWSGCVLAPSGSVYGIPYDSTTILKIDPSTDNGMTFGSLSGTSKWYGGVLAPNNSVYGIPYSSSSILKIDTTTDIITTFGGLYGSSKWVGGVVATNGSIYCIPNSYSLGQQLSNMSSYAYYKQIMISHSLVSSDLINFPICIQFNGDTDVGAACLSSGNDIRFVDVNGATLYAEKDSFTITGGAATGVFWVNTSISSTIDTVIYMYYGNPGASAQDSQSSVWDSNFVGVWHFGDGTTLSTSDSTSYNNTGSYSGITAASGKVGGSAIGTGAGSSWGYIETANTTPVNMTIDCWIYLSGTGNTFNIFGASSNGVLLKLDTNGKLMLDRHNSVEIANYTGVGLASWQHIVATITSGSSYALYVNGVSVKSGSTTATIASQIARIGNTVDAGVGWAGSIDEFRLSNIVRSAAWIAFEYANQTTANGQLTIGTQQSNLSGAVLKIDTTTDTTTAFGSLPYVTTRWCGGVLAPNGSIYSIPYSTTIGDFGYLYSKKITISHSLVSSNLTNFPLCVQFNGDTDVGAACLSSGNDIRFIDSNGNILYAEKESFVITGGAATGIFWVKVLAISSIIDTVIYMYYGNPSASAQSLSTSVWDSNYGGVWHLGDGVTLNTADSTINANNGTASSITASPSGKVGGCATGFTNNTANKIVLTNNASLQTPTVFTYEAWIYLTLHTGSGTIIGGSSNSGQQFRTDVSGSVNTITFLKQQVTGWSATGTFNINTWVHAAFTYSSGAYVFYINGAPAGSGTNSQSLSASTRNIGWCSNSNGESFNGSIDEVRISNIARSAAWMAFQYANQSAINGQLTIGSQTINGAILKIDPTTDTATTFGSLPSATTTLGWFGGVLTPNGSIYCIPHSSTTVLKIDTTTDTTTTFGSLTGTTKWIGGALSPNGMIYGIPYTSSTILKIDPTTDTATTFGTATTKCIGGVMALNGVIYCVPCDTTTAFLKIGAPMIDIQIDFPLSRYFNKF
jgi:hypothetical protein